MNRRRQIPDTQSIHVRPPQIEERLIPVHREGDLTKGAGNRSSVGTLVERTSGFIVLAKMSSADAADALERFGKALKGIRDALRKRSRTTKAKMMSYRTAPTLRTGVQVNSPTHSADGSAVATGTPTDYSASTYQRAPACPLQSSRAQPDRAEPRHVAAKTPLVSHHWRSTTITYGSPKRAPGRFTDRVARGP
ncbi:MAG: hypothetical protein ABI767_04765 [Rhodanobacter sp.]